MPGADRPVAGTHHVRDATKTPFLGVGCRQSGMRRACFAPRRSRVPVEKRQPYGNEKPAWGRQLADGSAQVVDLLVGRGRLERPTNGLKGAERLACLYGGPSGFRGVPSLKFAEFVTSLAHATERQPVKGGRQPGKANP